MTAATHARLCNTAPQAPYSELRTSYIVIRTFKLRFIHPKRLTERYKIHFSVPRCAEVPIGITCIVICGPSTLFAGILLELNEKTCYFSSWLIDFDF